MEIGREKELDAESYQIRETFTQFGLAMFEVQRLELSITNALFLAQVSTGKITTQEKLEETFEKNMRVTMGALLIALRPYIEEDTALGPDLEEALRVRNRFAHHFFTDHGVHFESFSGRELMLSDALVAQDQFAGLSERLELVLGRYEEANNITPEMLSDGLREASVQLRTEAAEDYDTPNCPTCLTVMQIHGTETAPHWWCTNCGLSGLI